MLHLRQFLIWSHHSSPSLLLEFLVLCACFLLLWLAWILSLQPGKILRKSKSLLGLVRAPKWVPRQSPTNFSLINLNRSLTDHLFTRNLAVSQVLRWFEISSQILPLSTVLSLNLYGWQTSISRQRRRSCSSFHSMLVHITSTILTSLPVVLLPKTKKWQTMFT